MGSQLGTDNSFRILETGREKPFNKRTRTEDDFVCNSAPRSKMQKLNDKDLFRQHNRLEVYNQIRGNDFNDLTRHCNSNTRNMQPAQHKGNVSTYSGDFEHSGRHVEPTKETVIRINNLKEDVQLYSKKMGEAENRHIRSTP